MKISYLRYKKLIVIIIVTIIFYISALLIKYYFKAFFFIVIMLFLCYPLDKLLNRCKIFSSKINAAISIALINILILLLIIYIGNYIYVKANFILKRDYSYFLNNIEQFLTDISRYISVNISDINNKILKFSTDIFNSEKLKKGAAYTTDGIFSYIIGNIAAYFILSDKYAILNSIKKIISKKKFNIISGKIKDINGMLCIELILVLISTFITIAGFLILKIGSPVMLGIICAILDILPYIGTILVFGPLILIKFLNHCYIVCIGLICLYILVMVTREIMEAKFVSNKLKLHPLITLLSIYIGIKLLGVIGFLLGPLYALIIKELLKEDFN